MADSADKLNMIKNPSLTEGRARPNGWRWIGDAQAVQWSREPSNNGQGPVMTLRARRADATAGWTRRVRCKSDEHYRVEVVVSCDCRPPPERRSRPLGPAGDPGGFVLSIQPLQGGEPVDSPAELIAPPRLDQPTRLRAYYQTPEHVRSIEVQVGLAGTAGFARVHEVMMFEIIEPEAQSHVFATPPPPHAYPAPKPVRSVCVCTRTARSGDEAWRPVVALLAKRFGRRSVRPVGPGEFGTADLRADALLFPDALPRSAANLAALEKLADDRMVVVSLPAFARIAGQACEMRTIEQADDPIHAKVQCGNFITRGFAIADVFPYAWRGTDPRVFVQRHFRRTLALRKFCGRHGFETILTSLCNTDAASDRPICLYKPTTRGGIVVLDVEPVEQTPTSFDEPDLGFYLLCNVLGAEQSTLGQYVCPARDESELRDEVAELGQRYFDSGLVVHGCGNPDKPRRDQLIEVGGKSETFGLPGLPRPAILIRTGLRGDDTDGVYGAMIWLKDLLRSEPYVNPYAQRLISRYRVAWIPLCANWHPGQGWRHPRDAAQLAIEAQCEPESLAAVIDITSSATRAVSIVVSDDTVRRRWASLLPVLFRASTDGRFFYRCVPAGRSINDRAAMDWRFQKFVPQVVADDAGVFDTDFHRQAAAAGATLIRLEFPGPPDYPPTGSIWRTDLVAQTLEHVVGLLQGWVAVNRQERPLRISTPNLGTGASAVMTRIAGSEPVETPCPLRPGKTIVIPPASAMCIRSPEP